jgi:hypothetical protein
LLTATLWTLAIGPTADRVASGTELLHLLARPDERRDLSGLHARERADEQQQAQCHQQVTPQPPVPSIQVKNGNQLAHFPLTSSLGPLGPRKNVR